MALRYLGKVPQSYDKATTGVPLLNYRSAKTYLWNEKLTEIYLLRWGKSHRTAVAALTAVM